MPDPALSAAFQEAYASAPVDQVIYRTLELWHAAFSAAIRVMRDFNAIDARIEAGAARDAGAVVTFVAFAFDIVPPDQTTSGVPQCVIEIDNVSREILAQIDLAVVSAEQIKAICRAYLSDAFTAALPGAATGMADQITALPFAGDASLLGVALWGVSLAFRYRDVIAASIHCQSSQTMVASHNGAAGAIYPRQPESCPPQFCRYMQYPRAAPYANDREWR